MKGEKPAWLELGQPVENINELFAVSRVFIQASRRETFSYAVCEAAFAGLPVRTNYCKVEEKIPAEWLPLVYYVGDYNYIQIATPKD